MTATSRVVVLACALAACLVGTGGAQQAAPGPGGAARRQQLEQRFRQRMAAVVKQRVGLNDQQMRQLGDINRKYEEQRRALHQRERLLRIELRHQMRLGDSANQQTTARTLDSLLQIQRRRLDLVSEEQRELASFMTPVQRARYLAMQDMLRRRLEQQSRQGGARPRPRVNRQD